MLAVPSACNPAARRRPGSLFGAAARAGTGAEEEDDEQGAAAGEAACVAVVTSYCTSLVALSRARAGGGTSIIHLHTPTMPIPLPAPFNAHTSQVIPLVIPLSGLGAAMHPASASVCSATLAEEVG